MDSYLKTLKEIQAISGFIGTPEKFILSDSFISLLNKNRLIPVNLKKGDMNKERRDLYIDYLVFLTQEYVEKNNILSWDDFILHKDCQKSYKILFQFGDRRELYLENHEVILEESLTKLTFK
jgi:hypothetical protein